MRQFKTRQTSADKQITPQECKSNLGMSLKQDVLYAGAWEFEHGKPIFDAENNIATSSNSPEIPVMSNLIFEETQNTPGTAQECSPEYLSQTEQQRDVTDRYLDTEPDMETNSEQPNKSPTNPGNSKYSFYHNLKPNCIDDYRYAFAELH